MAGNVKPVRDDVAFLADLKKRFTQAIEADRENRDRALQDAEFEADTGDNTINAVWPPKIKQAREQDGRICLTINKSRTITRQVANELRLQPPAISVAPSEDGDVATAAVIEGLVRSIEQRSKAKRIYAKAGEDAARGNMGFWRVTTDYVAPDSFDQEILIKPILNPLSVVYDPAAQDATCRDARFCFVYDDMPKEEFEARFKDKTQSEFYADGSARMDGEWIKKDTIRLAEYWCVEEEPKSLQLLTDGSTRWADDKTPLPFGVTVKQTRQSNRKKVCMYLVSGAEVLEEHEWAGDRIPIIPVWGEIARIGGKQVRNGVLTYARDAMRLHSFARSANAETVAAQPKAPYLLTAKMVAGYEKMWAQAATGNPAVLYYNVDPQAPGGKPERLSPPTPSAGWVQEALQSADDIKATTGIFDASLGAKSNETSGKAIIARQREGDVGTYTFVDNVMDAIEETGRVIIDLIPHIYDAPREIRILGKKMEPQILAVNQALYKPVTDQNGQPVIDPNTGQPAMDLQHIDLTVGRYDVTVSTGPSVTTQRQETAELLTNALQAAPMLAPVILPRLAEVIDLPDADEFAAEVKALLQPQPQQAPPPNPKDVTQAQLNAAKAQGHQLDNVAKAHNLQVHGDVAPPSAPSGPEPTTLKDQSQVALNFAKTQDLTLKNMVTAAQLGLDPMGVIGGGQPPAAG